MNNTQKVVLILLVLAVLFSLSSMFMVLSANNSQGVRTVNNVIREQGDTGRVSLYIEPHNGGSG